MCEEVTRAFERFTVDLVENFGDWARRSVEIFEALFCFLRLLTDVVDVVTCATERIVTHLREVRDLFVRALHRFGPAGLDVRGCAFDAERECVQSRRDANRRCSCLLS